MTVDSFMETLKFEDSYSRLPRMIELYGTVPDDVWFTVLGDLWEVCDNVGKYTPALRTIFRGLGTVRQMMTDEENAFFDSLPDKVTVYRGCGLLNQKGISWTTDRDVAVRFPYYNRYWAHNPINKASMPFLMTKTIPKKRITAVKLGREESEVVTFYNPRNVTEERLPIMTYEDVHSVDREKFKQHFSYENLIRSR